MKELKNRLLTAWWVLIGRKCLLTAATQQTIYVREPGRDGQIVQLVPWRDQILALMPPPCADVRCHHQRGHKQQER